MYLSDVHTILFKRFEMNHFDSCYCVQFRQGSLREYGVEVVGSIREDSEILESSLERSPFRECGARKDMEKIVDQIEKETIEGK